MAGDWIAIQNTTPNKREALRISRKLGLSRDEVLGKLVRFWIWADENTVDGHVDGLTSTDVDVLVGVDGFASCLQDVGWLNFDDRTETLGIPNFEKVNGNSSKNRLLKNRRQQKWRRGEDGSVDAPQSTKATTTEENRRVIPVGGESARDYIWRVGVDLLTAVGEKDRAARSFLGKLCKQHGNDAVREAVGRCAAVMPAEPKAWLQGALKHGGKPDPMEGVR